MSFENFKATLMLARMVLLARKDLVGSGFCNLTIGVGLVKKGKKLTINTEGTVTVTDTDESNPMTYEDVDTTAQDLEITVDKTVAIKLHDRDMHEVEAGKMAVEAAYASRMVYQLQDEGIDQLVFAQYANAGADNFETGSTPWQWGAAAADVPKFFAAVHKQMDDANLPQQGRFLALPNVAIQGLRLYYGTRESAFGDEVHRNGLVAKNVFGFSIYQSTNVVTASSVEHGIAGIEKDGIALAVQISPKIEKLRLEGYWADGIRARVTAGAKVYKSDRVIDINLNETLLA